MSITQDIDVTEAMVDRLIEVCVRADWMHPEWDVDPWVCGKCDAEHGSPYASARIDPPGTARNSARREVHEFLEYALNKVRPEWWVGDND